MGVCLSLHVCGCMLVENGPSMSGKQCHSYINKPDRGGRRSLGSSFGGGVAWRGDGWRKWCKHKMDFACVYIYVCDVHICCCFVFKCVCVFVCVISNKKLHVVLVCRPVPHILVQELCSCFPVNIAFLLFRGEGHEGPPLPSHLILPHSLSFSLWLILQPSLSPPSDPLLYTCFFLFNLSYYESLFLLSLCLGFWGGAVWWVSDSVCCCCQAPYIASPLCRECVFALSLECRRVKVSE